jgi:hypothetical protein
MVAEYYSMSCWLLNVLIACRRAVFDREAGDGAAQVDGRG